MKFYVLLSLIIFCCSGSFAQGLRQTYDAELYSSYEIDVKRKGQYMLNFGKEVTSVSFSTYEYDFEDAFITVEKDTFLIEQDIHFVDDVGAIKSSLIVLDDPCGYFVLHAKGFKGLLEIHLNHLKPFAETEEGKKLKKKKSEKMYSVRCDEPYSVPPSVWRDGLGAPLELPDSTAVKHIIVHHSASSNTYVNSADVVRNIYVFHTKPVAAGGRGYNDIAYNFLIGLDGVVYQGRDEQGLYDKDNIKGAHLCAKNDNTMGVCLLGNFETANPSGSMLNALYALVTWKIQKEDLELYASSPHPVLNPDRHLQVLAGHRQGCGTTDTSAFNRSYTACPGDSVVHKIQRMRYHVSQKLEDCSYVSSIDHGFYSIGVSLYPNPVDEYLFIGVWPPEKLISVDVLTLEGKNMKTIAIADNQSGIDVLDLPPGVYLLKIKTSEKMYFRKIVKR